MFDRTTVVLWLRLDFVLSGQTLFGQNQESHGVNLESLSGFLFSGAINATSPAVQNIRSS